MVLKTWEDCRKCNRCWKNKEKTEAHKVFFGEGSENSDILVVLNNAPQNGEALGKEEKKYLSSLLSAVSDQLLIEEIYITNLVGCQGGEPTAAQINKCKKRVQDTIYKIDPKVIVFIGEDSVKKISGILAKDFKYEKIVNQGLFESSFPGKLSKVPRVWISIPEIKHLIYNHSKEKGSVTHNTFNNIKQATKYIEVYNNE